MHNQQPFDITTGDSRPPNDLAAAEATKQRRIMSRRQFIGATLGVAVWGGLTFGYAWGVGTVPPRVRLNCRPEITEFTLAAG